VGFLRYKAPQRPRGLGPVQHLGKSHRRSRRHRSPPDGTALADWGMPDAWEGAAPMPFAARGRLEERPHRDRPGRAHTAAQGAATEQVGLREADPGQVRVYHNRFLL
jgi:hypothetical protein